jgi:hypothetical protein
MRRPKLLEPFCGAGGSARGYTDAGFDVTGIDARRVRPAVRSHVTGTGGRRLGVRLDGKGGNSRKPLNLAHAREAMGIDWMTRVELAEAVPPAMTEWVGAELLAHLATEAVA